MLLEAYWAGEGRSRGRQKAVGLHTVVEGCKVRDTLLCAQWLQVSLAAAAAVGGLTWWWW